MSLGKLFYSQQKNYQNIGRKTKMTLCWKYLDPSLNNCEVLTQWDFVILYPTLTYIHSNLNTLSNFLEANQCIDGNMCNKKPGNLVTNFHNTVGEANLYVRFGYSPLEIWNHNQGNVSGSMNADPINMIHTHQQSTE